MTPVTFLLPYPPSTNRLWRYTSRGVYRTSVYKEWLTQASLTAQWNGLPIAQPVAVELRAGPPDKRKRDLDNLLKPVGDWLEHFGILENDHWVHRWTAMWDRDNVQRAVMISLSALDAADQG